MFPRARRAAEATKNERTSRDKPEGRRGWDYSLGVQVGMMPSAGTIRFVMSAWGKSAIVSLGIHGYGGR